MMCGDCVFVELVGEMVCYVFGGVVCVDEY